MKATIEVEMIEIDPTNHNRRDYHLTKKVFLASEVRFDSSWQRFHYSEDLKKIGEIGSSLVEKVLSFEGISEIYIRNPYTLCVLKKDILSWERLEPRIIKAITALNK